MTGLDALIARAPEGAAGDLEGLEDAVWARVDRAHSRARERRLRLAALGVAASIGGIAGGVTAPPLKSSRSELSVFSPRIAATPLDVRSVLG